MSGYGVREEQAGKLAVPIVVFVRHNWLEFCGLGPVADVSIGHD